MNIIDKATNMIGWRGSKPDIKKKLDSLKVGERYYDPNTQTRYECIRKLSNGESVTIAKSLNVEVI